ncbi:MAG: DEAD/DEAH box helicase [Nanoarchaeota archaeon]
MLSEWFFSTFKEFSIPQLYGVMEIHNKNNILISAPTGGTKTLTAFLSIINELMYLGEANMLEDMIYCIYISPLKALSRDIEKNLQEPLEQINKIAKQHKKEINIRIGLRTGDTSSNEKNMMLKKPPHILITTPETLAITLTSIKFRELMRQVRYVIIDEIHALAENKRGQHNNTEPFCI